MKRLILSLFLFSVVLSLSMAQSNKAIAVAASKMNVLYAGIDNPVDIAVEGESNAALQLTISEGTIVKKKDKSYVVRVQNTGTVTLSIYKGTKLLGEKEFRVRKLPTPKASVGNDPKNMYGGLMPKAQFLVAVGVQASMADFNFDLEYTITEFTVTSVVDGYGIEIKAFDAKFTVAQKELIQKCRTGSKIYIESIKAKAPDGRTISLGSLVFKLR